MRKPEPDSISIPTLARLSFWVPANRLSEFETAYKTRLAPILKKHGLVESPEQGRPTAEDVFSRLFEIAGPAAIAEKQEALTADPQWKAVLKELGASFDTATPDALLQYRLGLYQTPAGPGQILREVHAQGYWRTYGEVRNVTSICQDRQGHLWFGTVDHVTCYDGHQWTTFTTQDGLASNIVLSILEDREGNLWFGTTGGMSRYDGKSWTPFTTKDGLASNTVGAICQDREGRLWFSTRGIYEEGRGVTCYDGQRWTTFTTQDGLASNIVLSILEDREGNLWFGTAGGVSRYDGRQWTTFTTKDGLASNQVVSILQDREGNLWFGTAGGVSRYDGRQWTTFATKDGLASNTVGALCQDREGRLWFGTGWFGKEGGGVTCYDGQQWTTFTTRDGLAHNQVTSIFQDREGNLWLGTAGGLSRYDEQRWTSFTEHGLKDLVSILQDQAGGLWFGRGFGEVEEIFRYDGQHWTRFTTADGLAGHGIWSMLQDRQGRLWFTTIGGGICCYDGKSWTVFTTEDGLVHNGVISSLEDREGRLWFGTIGDGNQGAGVSCFDGQRWTSFTTADGLAHNRVKWITQDREGNLWFGTAGGVSRYDGKSWTTFATQDGLVGDWVESMLQDREGNLWFGTTGGVSRYDGKSWTAFATQDGLPAPWATAIFQDQQGHLWFGTFNGGVCCYDGQVFQVLDQRDGLAGNMVWGIHQDGEGRLWFTTENGATCYRPSALEPPGVCIDAAIANRRYEQFEALALPSRSGLVAFEFHGTSLTARPGALVFRYRLEGGDAEWRTTRAGHVEYPDLSPGLYTFQVQAVDQQMQYSPLAEVRFRVRDPQEERIEELEEQVRERTRELEEKNRALEQANAQIQEANQHKSQFLSRMSHDLRTPMNAIIGYTRILLRKAKDALDERQYQNLQNIQLSADHLLALINDILDLSRVEAGRIELKPEAVDLGRLVQECAASVESLLRPGVELKQELADLAPLHTDVDRLNRVLMNLLSNAVKFTEQGSITVSVRSVDGVVELAVADTGIGIPAEDLPHIFEEFRQAERQGQRPEGSGLGLAIAKKSVELLGGTIAVESTIGRGTAFTLRLRDLRSP